MDEHEEDGRGRQRHGVKGTGTPQPLQAAFEPVPFTRAGRPYHVAGGHVGPPVH